MRIDLTGLEEVIKAIDRLIAKIQEFIESLKNVGSAASAPVSPSTKPTTAGTGSKGNTSTTPTSTPNTNTPPKTSTIPTPPKTSTVPTPPKTSTIPTPPIIQPIKPKVIIPKSVIQPKTPRPPKPVKPNISSKNLLGNMLPRNNSALLRGLAGIIRGASTKSAATALSSLASVATSLGAVLTLATGSITAVALAVNRVVGVTNNQKTAYDRAGLGDTQSASTAIKIAEALNIGVGDLSAAVKDLPLGVDSLKPYLDLLRSVPNDRDAAIIARNLDMEQFLPIRRMSPEEYKELFDPAKQAQVDVDRIGFVEHVTKELNKLGRGLDEFLADALLPKQPNRAGITPEASKAAREREKNKNNSSFTKADSLGKFDAVGGNNVQRGVPGVAYPSAWNYHLNAQDLRRDLSKLGHFTPG